MIAIILKEFKADEIISHSKNTCTYCDLTPMVMHHWFIKLFLAAVFMFSCSTVQQNAKDNYKKLVSVKKEYIKIENGVLEYSFKITNKSRTSIRVSTGVFLSEMKEGDRKWCEYLKKEQRLTISYSIIGYPIEVYDDDYDNIRWSTKLSPKETEVLQGRIEINQCYRGYNYNGNSDYMLKSILLKMEAFKEYVCSENKEYCKKLNIKKEVELKDIDVFNNLVRDEGFIRFEEVFDI